MDQTDNVIDRAAADWAAAAARGLSPEEESTLSAWLASDIRCQGAYVRSQALWSAMGQNDLDAHTQDVDRVRVLRRVPDHSRRRWLAGGAALAAAAAGAAMLQGGGRQRFDTARGEVRQSPLADGSSIALNTETRLVTRFSDARRYVRLEAGEAWFDVAADRTRPFTVEAGDALVTAVGTAFTLRRHPDHLELVVTEGVVEARNRDDRQRVGQGYSAIIPRAGAILLKALDAGAVQRKLAWRAGQVILDGERMQDAVATFNRYSERPIRLADTLADRRIVGVFRTQDADGFARAAGEVLQVPIMIGSDHIQIGVS